MAATNVEGRVEELRVKQRFQSVWTLIADNSKRSRSWRPRGRFMRRPAFRTAIRSGTLRGSYVAPSGQPRVGAILLNYAAAIAVFVAAIDGSPVIVGGMRFVGGVGRVGGMRRVGGMAARIRGIVFLRHTPLISGTLAIVEMSTSGFDAAIHRGVAVAFTSVPRQRLQQNRRHG